MAVLCLLVPLPFVGKVILGFTVLVGFMFVALLRLGPDRIPFETWLWRRIRYRFQARRYTYHRPMHTLTSAAVPITPSANEPTNPPSTPIRVFSLPIHLAFTEVGITPLFTAFLTVVGVDFLVWLAQGGAAELATIFQNLLH